MPKNDMITGIVHTNKIGSDCEFEIATREEWEAMTEKRRETRIIEAMWESGQVEVYVKDE